MKLNLSTARIINRSFWIRLMNWEYWPSQAFYFPLIPYFIYLAIRARHPCFFTAVNPGIEAGGIGVESKFETIEKIPLAYRPKSVLIKAGTSGEQLAKLLEIKAITFPLIAKPDVGFRGLLVKKMDSLEEVKAYLNTYRIDFILQEFLDYPEEVGVLYYRDPSSEKGVVTSLTLKEFLDVKGDGQSTVHELVLQYPRAKLQLGRLKEQDPQLLNWIPDQGQSVNLGIIGNHSKGTRFINGNHLIDDALRDTFDQISNQVDGFYYGRFDIKCKSLDELKMGKSFKIIELNGVCSEPTHIYDAQQNSFLQSILDIKRHWGIIQQISQKQRQTGVQYWQPIKMMKSLLNLRTYTKHVKKLSAA